MSLAPTCPQYEFECTDPDRTVAGVTVQELAALSDELTDAATAIVDYHCAAKRLHTVNGRSEIAEIDAILEKTDGQLRRLRAAIHRLHGLLGPRSAKS